MIWNSQRINKKFLKKRNLQTTPKIISYHDSPKDNDSSLTDSKLQTLRFFGKGRRRFSGGHALQGE